MNKEQEIKALFMPYFGIKTIVMTNKEDLNLLFNGFESDGMGSWSKNQKQEDFDRLKTHLIKEDAYFNKHPNMANSSNDRWIDFCECCVELAALNLYFFDKPIPLLHPQCFDGMKAANPAEDALFSKPSIIEGIDVVRMDH